MGSEESCTFLISPSIGYRSQSLKIDGGRHAARPPPQFVITVMLVILGPDGPKFIPTVARATTDKDAPGAALGVQLTQDTSLPRGRAMAVSAEVEGGDGTSLPQGKAPAVPTEVEEDGGTNLPHGKAPAVPAEVEGDDGANLPRRQSTCGAC